MFNIQEYVQDLIQEGFELLEARCKAKQELHKRKNNMQDLKQSHKDNEYINVFRALQEKYKR